MTSPPWSVATSAFHSDAERVAPGRPQPDLHTSSAANPSLLASGVVFRGCHKHDGTSDPADNLDATQV